MASERVCAVAVRDERILWAIEAERHPDEPLGAAIATLLTQAPLRRWPRPRVVVAIGPSEAQTKRLAGLPPLSDTRALAQLVREGVGRFFLKNRVPLVTSGVRLVEPGRVWAAAFEQLAVGEVESACRAARLAVRAVVPTAVVLGRALAGERATWRDGALSLELTFSSGTLIAVRRSAAVRETSADATPTPVPALATLGARAMSFADAYGAALLPRDEAIALRGGAGALASLPAARRIQIAACVLALTLAASLLAPGLAARRTEHIARMNLASLARTRREVAIEERELARMTGALAEVSAFDSTRLVTTTLLTNVSRALPEGSALVTFRVDSAGGNVVALGPRAAQVLSALEHVPGLGAPEMVGPVTREIADGREVERVTIRFRAASTAPEMHAPRAGSHR